jgi:hypothetical protein
VRHGREENHHFPASVRVAALMSIASAVAWSSYCLLNNKNRTFHLKYYAGKLESKNVGAVSPANVGSDGGGI